MMFTGDYITGAKAAEWGLANTSVPAADLESTVHTLATRMAGLVLIVLGSRWQLPSLRSEAQLERFAAVAPPYRRPS